MAEHNDLGKEGENQAADYLTEKGYKILDRNWVFKKAEIDIIAQLDSVLAVVEVKTRSSLDFGLPQDFVKPKQIQSLVRAINQYVTEKDLDLTIRFDIVAVHKISTDNFSIEHIEDAFYHF